jgi:hypothetical protein
MNQAAYDAIVEAWKLTVKARALCPRTDASVVGQMGYFSPPWYCQRGAVYFVNLATSLTSDDVKELNQIGSFINRSFVITMAATLEAYQIVPSGQNPDRNRRGGDHAQLTKWLRNRFAHGHWVYDPNDRRHVETRALLQELFPKEAAGESGFVISIDGVLEPLKDRVLEYILATE